jgi:hypothetical protein
MLTDAQTQWMPLSIISELMILVGAYGTDDTMRNKDLLQLKKSKSIPVTGLGGL